MKISNMSSDEMGLRSWNRRSGARMIADIPSVTAPVVHSSFSHMIRFEMASEQAVRKAQPKATKNQFINPIPLSSKTDRFQPSGYSTANGSLPNILACTEDIREISDLEPKISSGTFPAASALEISTTGILQIRHLLKNSARVGSNAYSS